MEEHIAVWPRVGLAALVVTATILSTSSARADDDDQIRVGYKIIAEIFPKGVKNLNIAGKDRELVGLGSYLVNTTGCNDCHTYPNWAKGGNPFLGEKEQINTERYLSGGRFFGPIKSANITPDLSGNPAGLDRREFLKRLTEKELSDFSIL